ncbi:hypothetical protein KIN20_003182 [Parelaphostrongylus tenuis]|uniref:Uncharacterized protein n=1 Tax=Parelaphostrongylus tenuis TaxID=148309 RepID=A0AAD5QH90_PARTN|nr:hypothetical protein KIN20_003182 [Parelaphostrongylus tenuis]
MSGKMMTIELLSTASEVSRNEAEQSKWYWGKRFSFPRLNSKRHMITRPSESFRNRKDADNPLISYGFASLNTEEKCDEELSEAVNRVQPMSSTFFIHGTCDCLLKIYEQPVGAQADLFIASLGERNLHLLRIFLENFPTSRKPIFYLDKEPQY